MPQAQIKVDSAQAVNFSKVWTYKGVSIPVSEVSIQFATDFANVVLLSFISKAQQEAAEKAKKAKQPLVESA